MKKRLSTATVLGIIQDAADAEGVAIEAIITERSRIRAATSRAVMGMVAAGANFYQIAEELGFADHTGAFRVYRNRNRPHP